MPFTEVGLTEVGLALCAAAAVLSALRHIAEFRAAMRIVRELTSSTKNASPTGGALAT